MVDNDRISVENTSIGIRPFKTRYYRQIEPAHRVLAFFVACKINTFQCKAQAVLF